MIVYILLILAIYERIFNMQGAKYFSYDIVFSTIKHLWLSKWNKLLLPILKL